MRIEQPVGDRGSLKWIQRAVNAAPQILQPSGLPPIDWRSPLSRDGFAEYRDTAFLDLLGLGHLSDDLQRFWPRRGPQWDALGLTTAGPVLVEAKAHLREFSSAPSQAGAASLTRIRAAFAQVQTDLGVDRDIDWTRTYYQYANRLAHLWWLRQQGVNAALLFVSFINDADMAGPDNAAHWHAAFAAADTALGLTAAPGITDLTRHIHHVTPDIRDLVAAPAI